MVVKIPTDFQIHGLFAHHWAGRENPNPTFHRHNEIELGILARGAITETIAGRMVSIPPRTLYVFWAGFSHKINDWDGYDIWTLAIPLTSFLTWPLPHETFVHRLLHGELLLEGDAAEGTRDLDLMQRWYADLHASDNSTQQEIVLLEVQARLRRLALNVSHGAALVEPVAAPGRVAQMLQFIAEHYCEELTVASIAKAAETNASYAMELFKQSCGMSIMEYVNDQRVTHARRMLATVEAKILDVALASGFGSVSQFYNVFRRVCGQTPRDYALAHRRRG